MKQIKINEKCNQCGVCVVKCPEYFAETDDGDVRVIASSVNEMAELTDAVNSCPVKAIEIGAETDSKQAIQNYLTELEKLKNGITVTKKDIEFHEAFTRSVYISSGIGVSRYDYRSSSQAERAGFDYFVSQCYSQIDHVILERITDYRVSMIKPYYSTDSDSVYSKNNKKISELLASITAAVGAGKLPSDFCTIDIYPDTNDTVWKMLNRGEIIADNFISIVKREFSYSASDYKSSIDWDDMEDYKGKDVYNYNISGAARELGNDVGGALRYAKSDIEEASLGYVKGLVDSYNRNLKACLEKKIAAMKQFV